LVNDITEEITDRKRQAVEIIDLFDSSNDDGEGEEIGNKPVRKKSKADEIENGTRTTVIKNEPGVTQNRSHNNSNNNDGSNSNIYQQNAVQQEPGVSEEGTEEGEDGEKKSEACSRAPGKDDETDRESSDAEDDDGPVDDGGDLSSDEEISSSSSVHSDDDDDDYNDISDSDFDSKPAAAKPKVSVETVKTSQKRKPTARKVKVKEPRLEVLMDEKDVPSAPGKHDIAEDTDFPESGSTLVGSADKAIKNRIIKLLNTGFHENSNEHEAKQAMKLAHRLMQKHNISQAVMLKERDSSMSKGNEDTILKGGLVKVRIVNRKTRKVAMYERWINCLCHPICTNFSVDHFYASSRGRRCDVSFYGIYTNAQLAAYAFKISVERMSQMMAEYTPKKRQKKHARQAVTTKASRLSYAIGIAVGIYYSVEENLKREEEERKKRLVKARLAISSGEAYEESDNEDENDGEGYSFPNAHARASDSSNIPPELGNDAGKDDVGHSNETAGAKENEETREKKTTFTGDALQRRLEELEKENEAALTLVDHSAKIAAQVLKDNDIKILNGTTRDKPILFDRHSYEQGIEDSKEIDIDQRAIRQEVVNVKVEPAE
jgi:hypothetical protein